MQFREIYETENGLIAEDAWKEKIAGLYTAGKLREPVGPEGLSRLISEAVRRRIQDKRQGVLFSGGIDSTLIAFLLKRMGADFTCLSVGIKGSEDLAWASRAAEELGFKLRIKEFSDEEVEDLFRRVKVILKTENPVTISIGAVSYAGMTLAAEQGITHVFSGLGSEELFAGYDRHLKALSEGRDVNEECLAGLLSMHERDLKRDFSIARALNCKILTPFLDERLIEASSLIPAEEKISLEEKKIILRKSALLLGLPEHFCLRRKRAAQYGSGFEGTMRRLARRMHFKGEREYCASL